MKLKRYENVYVYDKYFVVLRGIWSNVTESYRLPDWYISFLAKWAPHGKTCPMGGLFTKVEDLLHDLDNITDWDAVLEDRRWHWAEGEYVG